MKISPEGLLDSATFIPSPNCDERPLNTLIDMIVIHSISLPPGKYLNAYVKQFFQNQLPIENDAYFQTIADLKVSAHLFINRKAEITQFVPFHQRAWHAGLSSWQGREKCNDFSIGIELEGHGDNRFEKCQYLKLVEVVHALRMHYPAITKERVVGHSDIAPGRKTDPGKQFDWAYLKESMP